MTDLDYIRGKLMDRIEQVCRDLLPEGQVKGGEWYVSGSKSPLGYAVSVVLRGHKKGLVSFWGRSKVGGSLLDLAKEIHHGDFRKGLEWSMAFIGMRQEDTRPQERRNDPKRESASAERRKKRRVLNAIDLWHMAAPIAGTLGEVYFRKRGITIPLPPTIRFREHHEYTLAGRSENGVWHPGPQLPCVLAVLQNAKREKTGIWQIFLSPDGGKAAVDPNKVGMGQAAGSCVRLGPVSHEIGICEGLETGLGIMQMIGDAMPIWPCLSTSGMMNVDLPPEVRTVRIFPDGDLPFRNKAGHLMPSPGLEAAKKARARLLEEGRTVIIEKPPLGADFLDAATEPHAHE